MDPNNNNQQINQQPPVNAPQTPVTPEQVGSPVPKTQTRYILYGALLGLIAVVVVGVIAFYFAYSPKKSTQTAVIPTPAPSVATEEQEVVVNNESDLEGLLVGLAQADNSLDQELSALTKDSDF
ncbi:MAG: hypothetical protein HY426_00995 [Candidatus Levybacteria bacterium]|nr:hypothetical protein [Candidatus Levybacteria bacterium]